MLDVVANVDPLRPVNGKKLVIFGIAGAVVFTLVMLFGTYLLATALTHFLQKPAVHAPAPGPGPAH